MTAKPATRSKPARRDTSKREANTGKIALDKVSQLEGQIGQLVNMMAGMAQTIETLKSPLPEAVQRHDPTEQMARQVLRETYEEDVEERPENVLPDHLKAFKRMQETGYTAKNNPVQITQALVAEDQEIGQAQARTMSSTGAARESLSPIRSVDDIEIDGRVYSKDKLEYEAFLHEQVYVRVADTSDVTMTPLPMSCNGGTMQYFVRNKPQWVKRKFLEPLARAKRRTYKQQIVKDEEGLESVAYLPIDTLLYPFEVLQDTPKGKQWLRNLLAQTA
jgi:hypothetical protein